jgi:hypothetical protein
VSRLEQKLAQFFRLSFRFGNFLSGQGPNTFLGAIQSHLVPVLSHHSIVLVEILQYFSQAFRGFCKRVPARCPTKQLFKAALEKQSEGREYEDRIAKTSYHFHDHFSEDVLRT